VVYTQGRLISIPIFFILNTAPCKQCFS